MSTIFKSFNSNDITTTKTLLHEAIPLTGALVSGTYGTFTSEDNIKKYAHGMFQSVYDYPYLSSSANHIFDITVGYSNDSSLSASTNVQNDKKINLYNQLAQVLMGHDLTGSIQLFDEDGNILAGGTKMREIFALNFARLLYKDEIKKGSFSATFGKTAAFANANNTWLTLQDTGGNNNFRVNSPAGEYGLLVATSGQGTGAPSVNCGLLFYQAGIAIITASVFMGAPSGSADANNVMTRTGIVGGGNIIQTMTGSSIDDIGDSIRHRMYDLSFNNTTELNSTIYFCRANHNEFNYSSNPTYLSSSKIVVKNTTSDEPVTYITGIELLSADGEVLGRAKLSECVKKTPSTEVTFRIRVDY